MKILIEWGSEFHQNDIIERKWHQMVTQIQREKWRKSNMVFKKSKYNKLKQTQICICSSLRFLKNIRLY